MKETPQPPPVQTDQRGEIRRFSLQGTDFAAISTKKGFYRGGDFHNVVQYIVVVRGEFEVTTRENERDVVTKKRAGELVSFPPMIPHLLKALTDSVFIEWLDGPFHVEHYLPYRKLVEEQLKNPPG